MTTEAELAQKLQREVFSPEANQAGEDEQEDETVREEEAEEEEAEEERREEEEETEVEVDAEPTEQEQQERLAEEEERPEEEEPPPDEEEETEAFYATATDRIRYKTREETEQALREQANTIGRIGQELGQLRKEREQQAELVNQLQAQVEQAQQAQRARPGGIFAPSFDLSTVEQAIESIEENELGPAVFIQQALEEHGDIGLAYAICDAWEEHNPVGARYARRGVDAVYEATQEYVAPEPEPEAEPRPTEELYAYLVSQVPDVSEYTEMMQTVASEMPDNHWASRDLVNGDESARLRALYYMYERAKDRSLGVSTARDQITKDRKQRGATARKRAAVASGQTSAGGSDTPRNNTARFLENMRNDLRRQGLLAEQQ